MSGEQLLAPLRRDQAESTSGPGDEMVSASLREVLSKLATGVTVLTTGGERGHGMTANAFCSVSLDPPLALCCVARPARIHEAILSTRSFGVSLLAADQQHLAKYFADRTRPQGMAQFDGVDWVPGPQTGAPLLVGSLAWVECGLTEVYHGGDHSIFLGEVLTSSRGTDRAALLFFSGAYHRLATPGNPAEPA
ncbi:flavin reductase family protein [Streptosporangium sp. NBC_01756]|uniref:flavin reductase family protein n=1 Tax=Streptosporangium sp. NBC_01756 TaxID=2975950 RepID=UPI002DD88FC8|nr:flavin reductase family protein [Streptosporangium sp. NBC_01756]WSC85397.1 flavin reductase family protein [Streptosporangium sp. NBC_01756]